MAVEIPSHKIENIKFWLKKVWQQERGRKETLQCDWERQGIGGWRCLLRTPLTCGR
jgi:hypothetical protein